MADPTVASWTPINMFAMLRALINNGCPVVSNPGAPTNGTSGTFVGVVGPGSILIDYTNKNLYVNTGTLASPTWSQVPSSGALSPELAQDAVVAGTTQTQAGATALTGQVVRVGTVAVLGDGVRLPASVAGLIVTLINDGANPMRVYGAGTETINSIATATGLYQGIGTIAFYSCTVAGNWKVPLSQLQGTIPVALTTNGAINPRAPQVYNITKAGVLADTLAAPVAADDGLYIQLVSETAFSHTLTATGLLNTGSAFVNVATFNPNAGASLVLMARNLLWNVMAANGISFS